MSVLLHKFTCKSLPVWSALVFCLIFLTVQYLLTVPKPKCVCLALQTSTANESRTDSSTRTFKNKEASHDEKRRIYVITPTYPRPQQLAELTRLAQTLMHVPNLIWLVIQDSTVKPKAVDKLLQRSGIEFVHLTAPMPGRYRDPSLTLKLLPRGVSNRNRGLDWIRANATSGVIYFADDDNSYDIQIFQEMRDTKLISMWPVGFLKIGIASPVVLDGKIVDFYSWIGYRKYPVDMAEFAFSVEFLLERPNAKMPYCVGYEEDGFLLSLEPFSLEDIQAKASNCTEVLVWHTQTKKPPPLIPLNSTVYEGTNIIELYNSMS